MKKVTSFMIVGLTIYLYIMYEWEMGIFLLAGELCFFLFCMVSAVYFSRKLKVHMHMDQVLIEQWEECRVEVELQNVSKIPMAVKVVVVYRYLSEQKEHRSIARAYVRGNEKKYMTCSFIPEHCGKIEIHTKKIDCYDFMGIFCKARRNTGKIITTVMPKPYPVNVVVSNRTRWFPVDGESYAQDRSGEDTAEIYDVREYQAGDRMQKVHWKLSAREDSLYIKEFSYPLGAAVVLMLEENGQHPEWKHEFSEAVISIAAALLEKNCPYYIAWKKKEDDKIQRMLIRTEEDLYEVIVCILEFEKGCLETDMGECYRCEYKNDTYSTLITIDTKLMMQINENEPASMMQGGLEQFFQETEIVV